MAEVRFNLRKCPRPIRILKDQSKTHKLFFKKFDKYINAAKFVVNKHDLENMDCFSLFNILLKNSFVLSIEDRGFSSSRGFINVKENKLMFQDVDSKKEHLITMNDSEILVKDLSKPILAKIDGEYNTNILEIFISSLEEHLVNIVIGSVFSKYTVYTKYSMLKRMTEIKWAFLDDIRWAILKVQKEVGIREKEFLLNNKKTMIGLYPIKKMIHNSISGAKVSLQPWDQSFPEEKDLFLQGGDCGVVFSKDGNYTTAFVEVFPKFLKDKNKTFSSFIRGEGDTFEKAEESAFNFLKKAKECSDHNWETRGRSDGCGFCSHCKVFNSKAFPDLKK